MKRRNTIQKQVISDIVKTLFHPSAEEIFVEVQKKGYPFSLATIYRNLNLMMEQGEIIKIVCNEHLDRFDNNIDNHYHFRCKECGKIIDLPTEFYMNDVDEKYQNYLNVDIERHDVQFIGTCDNCRDIKNKIRRNVNESR